MTTPAENQEHDWEVITTGETCTFRCRNSATVERCRNCDETRCYAVPDETRDCPGFALPVICTGRNPNNS